MTEDWATEAIPRKLDLHAPPAKRPRHQKCGDWANKSPIIITLDGAEQRYVLAYDQDEGWVERAIVPRKIYPKGDPRNDAVQSERHYGVVGVTLKPNVCR